jgi:hypothetical protein
MANNYYDMTGVLVLDKVTPVIKALFGVFELDENYPGNGQAYIACISESSDCSWDSVMENLQELAEGLGLKLEDDEGNEAQDVGEALHVLARHFNAEQNEDLERLIEGCDFDDSADIDTMFTIAKAFDDGHGLKAFKIETAWHCSKPRLFEFGGAGEFTGSHVTVGASSNQIVAMGERLETALSEQDIDKAAEILREKVGGFLAGVYDDKARDAVRAKLSALLACDRADTASLRLSLDDNPIRDHEERLAFAEQESLLEDVAEWVGLHYKVNFDAEPDDRRADWIERYKDAH